MTRSELSAPPKLRINLSADFHDRGGWGRHARNFAASLASHAEVACCGSNNAVRSDHRMDGDRALELSAGPFADAIGITLGAIGCLPQLLGFPRVVSTVWETSGVPKPFVHLLNEPEMVWVPTEWGRQIFEAAGVAAAKLRVVPEGVDANLFRPAAVKPARDRFRFLCVAKWETRKATAELVRAFVRTFNEFEPVELIMHCQNIYVPGFDLRAAIATEIVAARAGRPRIVASDHGSLADLIGLMQQSDAFVLPTRAEAWGLPILEAMACGLPCLVTDYGGHRAFANESNSYIISARQRPVDDPVNFNPQWDWGEWAEADGEHLQQLLRHVFENQEEAVMRGHAAREDAVRRWSWDNAAKIAITHLAGYSPRL
jgi:glycosyltransferase involved in cell wall biosynthesis